MQNEKKKQNEIVILARSNLNSIKANHLKHKQIIKLVMKTLHQLLIIITEKLFD